MRVANGIVSAINAAVSNDVPLVMFQADHECMKKAEVAHANHQMRLNAMRQAEE
jgi:hypothetical protein